MARLILNSYRAESNGPLLSVIFDANGGPLPSRTVEIKRAADAAEALAAYKAELAATGKPAVACMRIAAGDRSPPGFKALNAKFYHEVNL